MSHLYLTQDSFPAIPMGNPDDHHVSLMGHVPFQLPPELHLSSSLSVPDVDLPTRQRAQLQLSAVLLSEAQPAHLPSAALPHLQTEACRAQGGGQTQNLAPLAEVGEEAGLKLGGQGFLLCQHQQPGVVHPWVTQSLLWLEGIYNVVLHVYTL